MVNGYTAQSEWMITQTARKIISFALTITMLGAMLGLMSGCSSQPAVERQTRSAPVQRTQTLGERAATVAMSQLGVPYRYGGATTSGFDCSGLVQYSYRHAGKTVPRTTGQLWSSSPAVAADDLQVGDLLFFSIEGKMSHVGLYIGDQQFVHAPSSGRSVSVATLTSPFYSKALIRAGRPR